MSVNCIFFLNCGWAKSFYLFFDGGGHIVDRRPRSRGAHSFPQHAVQHIQGPEVSESVGMNSEKIEEGFQNILPFADVPGQVLQGGDLRIEKPGK